MKKVALITGAGGCIGLNLVNGLLQKGWDVIGSDISFKKETINHSANKLLWINQDLDQFVNNNYAQDEFKKKIDTFTKGKKLDCVIHNAAIQKLNSFQKLSDKDWISTFNINFFSPVIINRILLPKLIKSEGSIVNITSIHANQTKSDFSCYASSKAALNCLTRSMAVEIGKKVRVNAIEPAAILTPMLKMGFKESDQKVVNLLSNYHPSGNIGTPDDILRAVLFLIDPRNKFLNGCILPLNGGIDSKLNDPN